MEQSLAVAGFACNRPVLLRILANRCRPDELLRVTARPEVARFEGRPARAFVGPVLDSVKLGYRTAFGRVLSVDVPIQRLDSVVWDPFGPREPDERALLAPRITVVWGPSHSGIS